MARLVPRRTMGHMTRPANRTAHLSFQPPQPPAKHGRRRALGATTVAVGRGELLGAGASSAIAATSASAASMPRHPTANLHGEVNVTIWSIDSDGPDFQAILSGAIGDSGPP